MANARKSYTEEIVYRYLFDRVEKPKNLISEDFIRDPSVEGTPVSDVSAAWYMSDDGPGRFALPSLSPLVQAFFAKDENGNYIHQLAARTDPMSGDALSYSKAELVKLDGSGLLAGETSIGFKYQQFEFDDAGRNPQGDDLAERVFIWNNSSFTLDKDVKFFVDPNDINRRYIVDLKVVGRFSETNKSVDRENFDFVGGNIGNLFADHLQNRFDPSRIGRKVFIDFDDSWTVARQNGNNPSSNYTFDDFEADVLSTQFNRQSAVAAFTSGIIDKINRLLQDWHDDGFTRFLDENDRPIIYGTTGDDTFDLDRITKEADDLKISDVEGILFEDDAFIFNILSIFPGLNSLFQSIAPIEKNQAYSILSEYVENGVVYVLGNGSDTVTGTIAGDEIHGGEGNDVIDGLGGADEIYGGAGNDRLVTKDGEGALIIGGSGKDFIYNATKGGVVYGDTIDKLIEGTPQPLDPNSDAQSDKFWFFPGVTVMDPSESDFLAYYGIPLVGGTSGIPLITGLLVGGIFALGLSTYGPGATSSLYFDQLFPHIVYKYDPKKEQLIVVNLLTASLSSLGNIEDIFGVDGEPIPAGAMVFENYDNFSTSPFGWGLEKTGDLGMSFKQPPNEFWKVLETISRVTGVTTVGFVAGFEGIQSLPLRDTLATLINTFRKIAENLAWKQADDPLVLDLDGDGIETVSVNGSGVYFDGNNNFFGSKTGWLSGDDGFLALDKNANGLIDDISELFGDVGLSGFAELALYDLNNDGVIDAQDAVYSELKVWRDRHVRLPNGARPILCNLPMEYCSHNINTYARIGLEGTQKCL